VFQKLWQHSIERRCWRSRTKWKRPAVASNVVASTQTLFLQMVSDVSTLLAVATGNNDSFATKLTFDLLLANALKNTIRDRFLQDSTIETGQDPIGHLYPQIVGNNLYPRIVRKQKLSTRFELTLYCPRQCIFKEQCISISTIF